MNSMPFLFPGNAICDAFLQITNPQFAKLRANFEESRILAALRDTLLPKLISGEQRVKDAERFITRVWVK
jgi:type I restriction enzyme S subunit